MQIPPALVVVRECKPAHLGGYVPAVKGKAFPFQKGKVAAKKAAKAADDEPTEKPGKPMPPWLKGKAPKKGGK
jgi:hypothetical protein